MNTTTRKNSLLAGGFKRRGATSLFGIALAGLLLAGAHLATAQVMIVDRGLPTANLNNAAGPLRSNVEWADAEIPPDPFYLPGDDFTPPGPGPYVVQKIRVWSTDNTGLSLRGGKAGDPITLQSSSYTATPVTYANTEGYQKSSGAFLQIYQIDFSVNILLNGGDTYQFFLDGPATLYSAPFFANANLHASNAALSGSPQQGADNTFLWLAPDGSVKTWNSGTGGGTLCSPSLCSGWDKASDGNVQVFATLVVTSKDQCKNGGWQTLFRANGTPFKNQGDCIQYVNTGK